MTHTRERLFLTQVRKKGCEKKIKKGDYGNIKSQDVRVDEKISIFSLVIEDSQREEALRRTATSHPPLGNFPVS